MRARRFLILLLAAPALFACAAFSLEARRAERAATPALDFSSYRFDPQTPLKARVTDPPDFVLDYLKNLDGRDDYQAHKLTLEERAMVEQNLDLLNPEYKRVLQERLLGLYFVKDLLGSGYTEFTLDSQGRAYCFMAVNSQVLESGLSQWLTKKENTAFAADTGQVEIEVDCGPEARAFSWILFHEATHVLDYALGITPYVEPALKKLGRKPQGNTRFTQGIWESYSVPAAGLGWPYGGKVHFYGFGGGPGLALSQAPEIYKSLSQTPFASLYSAQNWAEDLADYLAFYHLTQTMGLPYFIRVKKGGQAVYEYSPFEPDNGPGLVRNLPENLLETS